VDLAGPRLAVGVDHEDVDLPAVPQRLHHRQGAVGDAERQRTLRTTHVIQPLTRRNHERGRSAPVRRPARWIATLGERHEAMQRLRGRGDERRRRRCLTHLGHATHDAHSVVGDAFGYRGSRCPGSSSFRRSAWHPAASWVRLSSLTSGHGVHGRALTRACAECTEHGATLSRRYTPWTATHPRFLTMHWICAEAPRVDV
jgi:hypothetical protein